MDDEEKKDSERTPRGFGVRPPLDMDWECECGWQGVSQQLKLAPGGMFTCPECGASGSLRTDGFL